MYRLNNLGRKLGKIAEITASKAKDISEIVKLNAYILSEENEIERAYIEIGRLVYEQNKDIPTVYITELFEKIQKSKEKIDRYKAKIEQVKNS